MKIINKLQHIIEIQDKAIKDAIYCKEYYSNNPSAAFEVAIRDLKNGLEKADYHKCLLGWEEMQSKKI